MYPSATHNRAESLAALCGVLADRSRLELLFLMSDGERGVGELAALTGLAQWTISHHLQLLRLHGLVESRRAHRRVFYRPARPAAAAGVLELHTRGGCRVRVTPRANA